MANKKFQIEFDIDSKDVKIAGGEMLNLAQQLRIFQKELKSGKLGAEEFTILSNKINETKDNLAAVNAKSGEFFNTISLLPGPIGNIGQSLDSSIGLLKTFSSFSLSNISSQLKGLGSDIGGIVKSLFGLNAAQKTTATSATAMAVAEGETAVASEAAAVATNTQTVATEGLTVAQAGATTAAGVLKVALRAIGIGLLVSAVVLLIEYWDKIVSKIKNAIPIFGAVTDAIGSAVSWFTDLIGVTSEAERAEERRQARYKQAAAATEVINQGIQREIEILKARGATQDQLDIKEKQMIKNRLKDLEIAANERGMLYGEQAKEYKDLQTRLTVIDETAKTKQREADEQAAKEAAQKRKGRNEKWLQEEKQVREQLLAYVKEGRDAAGRTREAELADEEEKYNKLKAAAQKYGLDLTNITKAYQQKKDQINKTFDDKEKQDFEKRSDEALKKLQEYLDKRNAKIAKARDFSQRRESQSLKQQLLDGLITQQEYDTKTLENNRNFAIKKQQDDENAYNTASASLVVQRAFGLISQSDFNKQREVIDAQYNDTKVQNELAVTDASQAIQENGLNNTKSRVEKEKELEKQRLQQKYDALDAVIEIAGAETAVGKAALIAKQILMAKELIMEVKKTITFSTQVAARSSAALAEGTAQTAKVGFPQNIPLLIAYAAQAAGIISAVLSAVRGAKASTAEAQSIGTEGVPNTPKPQINVVATRAAGGFISGAGTSTSDSIPTLLSNGEFIVNARAAARFGGLLNTINSMGNSPQFAMGGLASLAGSSNNISLDNTPLTQMMSQPIKAYVTTQDMTSNQQLERITKQRSII